MVTRQVRVPLELWDAAKLAADQRNETVSDVVRRALATYVKRTK